MMNNKKRQLLWELRVPSNEVRVNLNMKSFNTIVVIGYDVKFCLNRILIVHLMVDKV